MTDEIHNYMGIGVIVTLISAFLVTTSTSFAMTKPILDNQVNKFSTSMATYHFEDFYQNSFASLKSPYDGITKEQCMKVISNNKDIIKSIFIATYVVYTGEDKITANWNGVDYPDEDFFEDNMRDFSKYRVYEQMYFSVDSPFARTEWYHLVEDNNGTVEDAVNNWCHTNYADTRYNLEYVRDCEGNIHVIIRESYWAGTASYGPAGDINDLILYRIKTSGKIPNLLNQFTPEEWIKNVGRPEILLSQ